MLWVLFAVLAAAFGLWAVRELRLMNGLTFISPEELQAQRENRRGPANA